MNTTLSTQENAYFNKTFYDRKLLDTAKTRNAPCPGTAASGWNSTAMSFLPPIPRL